MGGYSGLVGAYRFAFRHSGSWLLRSYAVASGLLGAYIALLLLLALVTWLARPTGLVGERALLGVIAVGVLAPLFAPVLIVARRHRRGDAPAGDRLLALAGYAFVASIALGLFVSAPDDRAPAGALAALDALPRRYGLVPPVVAAAAIAVVAWLTRPE